MATQSVQATFMLNTGEVIDFDTTLTSGTQGELKTSTKYAVAATSFGQFANGKSIAQIIQPVTGTTGIGHAYVDRRGEILCLLPVAVFGVESVPQAPLMNFQIQAGDTIQVMSSTAASRLFSYNVITNSGVHAIFSATPAGAADTPLTHIKSGQGLGESLTGQSIVKHFATSVDGSKLNSGGGVYILSDRGLPVGGCMATNPLNLQPYCNNMGGAAIRLNMVARITTSS